MRMPELRLACSGLLAFLVGACAQMQWVKPDATPDQFNKDIADCQQEAWREAHWRGFLDRGFGPMLYDARGRRYLSWPYSPLGDPFGDPLMEESRLTHFCMRAKGYELVPVEPEKSS
jgi:hypothetical protein